MILLQIIPNYSKLSKLFQIIQIVQIRGIKRKVVAYMEKTRDAGDILPANFLDFSQF